MMIIIALIIYNFLFPIFFLLYFPVFISKLIRRGDFRECFWERFGFFSDSKKKKLRNLQNPIWIHAVSVGETIAALSFIREWNKKEPGLQFVLSTTTGTGQKIARQQSPENVISIYYPLDFFTCVCSAFKTIMPGMLIIFEVEIWPTMVAFAAWRKIRLALVNCRMSDKSTHGYTRYRWFFSYIFSRFSLICAQTEEDARRIKLIAGDQLNVNVCNTMKFDQVKVSQNDDSRLLIEIVFPDQKRIIFTAASTHAGEEAIMIRTLKSLLPDFPSLNLILAPRHAERANEIGEMLQREGMDYVLLTELRESIKNDLSGIQKKEILRNNPVISNKRVLLVDTTGDLMSLFAVSDIVFMGKSLAGNKGGHNIIEPAIYARPVIFGKNMENFRDVAKIFKDNNSAVEVEDEQEFSRSLRRLVIDPVERERLGKRARETVEKNLGAINKTIELINKEISG